MRRVALFLLLASLFIGTSLPHAQAGAESHGLTFSATLNSIKITARPGQVVTRQFRLTLDANQRRTHFKARVEDWWRSEDGKRSFFDAPGTLRHSCAEWTSLNPVESAVNPGDTLIVRITTTVPNELAPGGYWCALTVDQLPDPLTAPPGVGVQFVASLSTGVFVYVDPIRRDAVITDLTVQGEDLLVRVHNKGNAPLGIEGRLEFLAAGSKMATATAVMARNTLLTEPFVEGIFSTPLPSSAQLPAGRYVVRAVLDIGGEFDIGAEREIDIVRSAIASASIP